MNDSAGLTCRQHFNTPQLYSDQACLKWHNRVKIFSFLLLLSGLVLSSPISLAELKNHPSPYLAMHSDDPVHWLDWTPSVLEKAQQTNRPILISSGYFACHWCHVMQQESYQDAHAADLMNQHFISVKLDRELHPNLDHYLIEFARQVTGRAGWPQHVILTPQGYPFAAFGYLPNSNFINTLNNTHNTWSRLANAIQVMAERASQPIVLSKDTVLSKDAFEAHLLTELQAQMDDFSGGLKGSNKFPKSPLLLSLLTLESLPESVQAWLILTLDQMQTHHLKDHINGGFYRYTIDPEWQTPHFEKMGYDNALLAQLFFQAGQRFQRSDFINTAIETLEYMETHLFEPNLGLFASSQSALDQQGREGGDYLFNQEQLKATLSKPQFETVISAWQLNQPAPYDLGWHPRPTSTHWSEIKAALRAPVANIPKDSKHILSWNGLALSAYVSGYHATGQANYLKKANALSTQLTLLTNLPSAPRAVGPKGGPIGLATLEDFAYPLRGLMDLHTILPDPATQATIKTLSQRIQSEFLNENGWKTNQAFLLPGQNRQSVLMDNDLPSASAIAECFTPQKGLPRTQLAAPTLKHTPLNFATYLSVFSCQNAH